MFSPDSGNGNDRSNLCSWIFENTGILLTIVRTYYPTVMIRLFVFIVCLFVSTSLLAQTQSSSSLAYSNKGEGSGISMAHRGSNEYHRLYQDQLRLINSYVRDYASASPAAKTTIREKIYRKLHVALDYKLKARELEIVAMEAELNQMQRSDAFQNKKAQIYQLQESLLKVKKDLSYRQKHREEIVAKRMRELLPPQ